MTGSSHSSYSIEVSSLREDPEWDDYVVRSPAAHHEQTSLWGESQRLAGWSASRLKVTCDGALVGGAQILERPIGPFGSTVGYLNRGPLVSSDEPRLKREILEFLKTYARRRRMIYLAVILPYDGQSLEGELLHAGYLIGPDSLPPSTSMMSTIVIDLTLDPEKLLMRMRKTLRHGIRIAGERGVIIRQGEAGDLGTFTRLLEALCRRRRVSPNVPLNGFIDEVWTKFAPRGMLRLFLAEIKGKAVAALLVFVTGRWARAWRFGWSGEQAEAHPSALIYWEAIKWAKSHGCEFFDGFGFDSKYARALVNGYALPGNEICTASFFKLGFGGKVLPLFPKYCYFCNPAIRVVFGKFGEKIAASGVFRRLQKVALR